MQTMTMMTQSSRYLVTMSMSSTASSGRPPRLAAQLKTPTTRTGLLKKVRREMRRRAKTPPLRREKMTSRQKLPPHRIMNKTSHA